MNRELFSVRPGDLVADAVSGILGLGVTTAPVLDAGGCPLGVVSLVLAKPIQIAEVCRIVAALVEQIGPAIRVAAGSSAGVRLLSDRRGHTPPDHDDLHGVIYD
jgi:hypothetical protein